ncbi:hypothetical protein [Enterobacter phage IME278]|uniref:Uncharacterized protein n=1 Tax=Enterobacter phage IME278 TaxID=2829366 RepID=A0A8T8JE84_9CAUD|nr:hypothetical protein [Enterobacter phage IME278]
MIVTYGLCQHHVTNARLMIKTGQLNHDATMRHLKAVYEGRKSIHDSLHAVDEHNEKVCYINSWMVLHNAFPRS